MLHCLLLAAALSTPPAGAVGWLNVPHAQSTLEHLEASTFKGVAKVWPWDDWRHQAEARTVSFVPQDPAHVALHVDASTVTGDADILGKLDVAPLYSFIRHMPAGATYEQVIRRLGLERLQECSLEGRLSGKNSATATLDIKGTSPARGFFAALGPALMPSWPPAVPAGASFASLSLQPATMWLVGETVLAGLYPLEYSLARVQLDSLERDGGKRWVEDILGSAPRLWSAYDTTKGAVMVLEVQDGISALPYLQSALAVASDVAPEHLKIQPGERNKVKTLTVQAKDSAVYLAFLPQTIVVARSTASLEAHLAAKRKPVAWSQAPTQAALVFGSLDNSQALRTLAKNTPTPTLGPVPTLLGRSHWALTATPTGWHVDVTARN